MVAGPITDRLSPNCQKWLVQYAILFSSRWRTKLRRLWRAGDLKGHNIEACSKLSANDLNDITQAELRMLAAKYRIRWEYIENE